MMLQRTLGPFSVSAIGLGCMNLSHAYGTPPDEATSIRLLNEALDMGYNRLDTAALYGFGANESLLGKAVMHRRDEFVLASKCGMFKNAQGVREIDGHPATIRKTCEDSLQRLGTEVIDLYYLHRRDQHVPIEESIGALAELVAEGKIRSIGLSEVSATTLRKAHAVHPITALQTEYSLWTRNPELGVLETCNELGVAFVAFSPLGRGALTGKLRDVSLFEEKDIRKNMPRFYADNFARNLLLVDQLQMLAESQGCTAAQLSLAWLLARDENIIPIPGTTSLQHMQENIAAMACKPDAQLMQQLEELINQKTVIGTRYNAATQAEIDTEQFNDMA